MKLSLNYKFWIETEEGLNILGEGKWQLLKKIQETGSLKAAVESMGHAYRQTWDNLQRIEERLGFKLIDKQRGGSRGGMTTLTRKGEMLVAFFDRLYAETDPELQRRFDSMIRELNEIVE